MTDNVDPTQQLREELSILTGALHHWNARHPDQPDPDARQAGTDAVGAADRMLSDLYLIRARLVSEIRRDDDAAAARANALLNELRDRGVIPLPDQQPDQPDPGTRWIDSGSGPGWSPDDLEDR